MVKQHNVLVKISNESGIPMEYVGDWYDSGRVADGFSWRNIRPTNDHSVVLNYEKDNSWTGCSGYVQFMMSGVLVTIAFSNPVMGVNKLDVGTGGMGVYDNMDNHDNNPFVQQIPIGDGVVFFNLKCTGGSTNAATVDISKAPR